MIKCPDSRIPSGAVALNCIAAEILGFLGSLRGKFYYAYFLSMSIRDTLVAEFELSCGIPELLIGDFLENVDICRKRLLC